MTSDRDRVTTSAAHAGDPSQTRRWLAAGGLR